MTKKFFLFIPLILALFLLPFLFNQHQAAAEELVVPTQMANAEEVALQALETQRDSTDDAKVQEQLDAKISALEYKLTLQEEATKQGQKPLEEICAGRILIEGDQTQKAHPTGILSVREDFLATQGLTINNIWRGTFQGYDAELYSGSQINNPSQGVVILSIPTLNLFTTILDPNPDGGLTIIEAENTRFTLKTSAGNTRYFDLTAQSFAPDAETALPAADLPPAPTPIYDPCVQFDLP